MDYVDVLYLSKKDRSTYIEYLSSNKTINKPLSTLLNEACLESLSTLNGRLEAIKTIYNISKCIPVYINQNAIMQPLYDKKAWNQIYVNICNIVKLTNNDEQTKILFIGGKVLNVDISMRKLSILINKCLIIKENQS